MPFGGVEQGVGEGRVALAVEGERDPGAGARAVGDLGRLSRVGAGAGAGWVVGEGFTADPVAVADFVEVDLAAALVVGPVPQPAASAPPATSPAPARSAARRLVVVTRAI